MYYSSCYNLNSPLREVRNLACVLSADIRKYALSTVVVIDPGRDGRTLFREIKLSGAKGDRENLSLIQLTTSRISKQPVDHQSAVCDEPYILYIIYTCFAPCNIDLLIVRTVFEIFGTTVGFPFPRSSTLLSSSGNGHHGPVVHGQLVDRCRDCGRYPSGDAHPDPNQVHLGKPRL